MYINNQLRASTLVKSIVFLTAFVLLGSLLLFDFLRIKPLQASVLELPSPIELLEISDDISYPVLKAIKLNRNDPTNIDFLIDSYDRDKVNAQEANRIVNYFLAGLTTKESDLWVNLSPYESDRIMYDGLEKTDFGKELLTQDYILKQFVSSLTYPDSDLGKEYWSQTKTSDNFNKVWIVPSSAVVRENGTMAYVKEAKLDVQYEKDYLAQLENGKLARDEAVDDRVKDKLLEAIRYEVNNGENFAQLRQLYHSLVLATWFKKKFQNSFYKHYIDNDRTSGIDLYTVEHKDEIYSNYVESFRKGVYDLAKKEYDRNSGRKVRRRYFSGGVVCSASAVYSVEFEDKLSPNIEGTAYWLKGDVLPEYNQDQKFSSSVKLPKLDYSRVEDLLVYHSKINKDMVEFWKQFGMEDKLEAEEERKRTYTGIQRKNFKAAIEYFNSEVIQLDADGKLKDLSWSKLMDVYGLFRGDTDEDNYAEAYEQRLAYVDKNLASLIETANRTDYRSTAELYESIAQTYSYFIEYQPFIDVEGFTVIKEKGDSITPKASGHNRLAWFVINYMLLKNGQKYLYLSDAEQKILNGKASARHNAEYYGRKKEYVINLLEENERVNRKISKDKEIDYYRVEPLIKYHPAFDEKFVSDLPGMEEMFVKHAEQKEKFTKILRKNFRNAIDFFNSEVVASSEGKVNDLTIENLLYMYALFRGDVENESFEEIHKARVKAMSEDYGFIHAMENLNNTKFDSKEHFLTELAGVYSYFVDVKPFLKRDEFTSIEEKGAEGTLGAGGHNRIGWAVLNYMMVKNGYGIFYFKDGVEQEQFSGKGFGSELEDINPKRVNILADTLDSMIQNGGIDLNTIDIEVEASSALLADVEIDFDVFAGFTYRKQSIAKLDSPEKFFS